MKQNRFARMFAAAAAIALTCGLSATAHAAPADQIQVQGWQPTDARLRWAPPVLVNPVVIELGDGPTYTQLKTDQDYVIKLPKTKKVGSTVIDGGRNVVIIGGYITLPMAADGADGAVSRAISIRNNVGVVHIEGVLIDASGRGMSDGIDIESPRSTVQIENVGVDGVYGFYNQFHAHVIKPFGGVAGLRIDKLTGYTAYQGLTISIDLGPIGSAEISRTNLVGIGDQIWGRHNNGGYLVWLTHDAGCKATYPIQFRQVYVQPRRGTALANAVWPPPGGRTACPSAASDDDAETRFPSLPVQGRIRKGMPPQGDFVPPGVAGLHYVSPGYRQDAPDWKD